jgi:hypothetical protein
MALKRSRLWGKTMKYPIKCSFLTLFLAVAVQTGVFSPCQANMDRATDIAQQMCDIAPDCKRLSSEAMKARRLEFLNNNKDATIRELVKAIDLEVDGVAIRTRLKSYNCAVCNEYYRSVEDDYNWELRAMDNWYKDFGDTTVEYLLEKKFL